LGDVAGKNLSLEIVAPECVALRHDAALFGTLLETARKQVKDDPKQFDFGMRLAMGLLCLDDKRFPAASEFLDLALAAQPQRATDILLTWGVTLLADDRPAEAAAVLQRAAADKASSKGAASVEYYLASALEMAGRTDEALAVARTAAQAKKAAPRTVGRAAWILFHAKRYKEAESAYRALLEKYDADYSADEIRDVVREAKLLLASLPGVEGTPAGDEWLEQVLDEFPDDISAMNDLGYLWADRGEHLERAERMIRRAVKEEPANNAYRDSLGWVLFRLGRIPDALAELEKAAAVEKPDAVILDHLGDVYAKIGRRDKAQDAWRRAVELFKSDNDQDKVKRTEAKLNAK
jgi:tetratricopeptide (TPR) repeat protein